jgi:hypothetical protein
MRVCENIEGELTTQTRVVPDSSIKLRGLTTRRLWTFTDVARRRSRANDEREQPQTI